MIKSLLDAGVKPRAVRDVFDYLRDDLGDDVATANLVIDGANSVLTRDGEEMIDLVRKGQGVLNIVPLSGVVEQVDASIHQLFPEAPAADAVEEPPGSAEAAVEP